MIAIIISIISLILSIIFSILGWRKNRALYDIEPTLLRADTISDIKKKLNSGKYMIVSVTKDEFHNTAILLGKIKK